MQQKSYQHRSIFSRIFIPFSYYKTVFFLFLPVKTRILLVSQNHIIFMPKISFAVIPQTDQSYSRVIGYSRGLPPSKRQGSHEREITEVAREITLVTLDFTDLTLAYVFSFSLVVAYTVRHQHLN